MKRDWKRLKNILLRTMLKLFQSPGELAARTEQVYCTEPTVLYYAYEEKNYE